MSGRKPKKIGTKDDDIRNPYGVSMPMTLLALTLIYLRTGMLPKQEIMDRIEKELEGKEII